MVSSVRWLTFDTDVKLWLEQTFKDAVFDIVRNMNGDKAPGPYGFSIAFSQHCWKLLKRISCLCFTHFMTIACLKEV